MKPYLVFRLYGPMASWGLPAVGGDRQTAASPTRSAILGLLGAALGVKRENKEELQALQDSVLVAIKQTVPSTLMRDYHTTQVPSSNNKVVHHTRKSELSAAKLNTILSGRDYRCDGLWVVAISLTEQAAFSLENLQAALLKPVYPLSLGRKSCPLAVPLMPKVLAPCMLKEALDTEFPALTHSDKTDDFWLGSDGWVTYFWQGDKNEMGEQSVLTTHPWDEPVSRERWQFKQRSMHQLSLPERTRGEEQ
ncbi:type I-E CRISPR-associated protein Cas5/CasD [Marinobacter sp. X15-166B]|nr:type I-E CRISPR-associated protein Cas5/CasD [Marinobacter sp. X15-166B]